jgi:hypothetical protein
MASWSTRRQLTYFFGFFAVLIAALALVAAMFWPKPSCQDHRRNQNEKGIDCGGECSAVCANEALPMRALWARVLPLGAGAYDLVAFISNPNPDLLSNKLPYEIKFVDQNNTLINSVRGDFSFWPSEGFPIFVPNINVGRLVPARAYVDLLGAPRWERSSSSSPMAGLTVMDDNFTNTPTPILKARLTNNSLKPIAKIDVRALLSDTEHNVFAAGPTFVEQLGVGETVDISFLWPRPFPSPPAFTEFYSHVAIEPTQ